MSFVVTINAVDRTSSVVFNSLRKTDTLNAQIDTLDFTVNKYGSLTYVPTLGHEVTVTRDGETIFGGVIVRITEDIEASTILKYHVECTDYSQYLKRQLVTERFEGETVADIIAAILTDYTTDGFTSANATSTQVIESISFNRLTVADCLQKLADAISYVWYVDYDKDVHFFPKNTELAPFNLSDTSQNYIYNSLEIVEDLTQIRNSVLVQGGEAIGASARTEYHSGDATRVQFALSNKFASKPTVTVGGVSKTVGVEYLDDDASYQCMWNFNEKYIRFTAGNTPASAANNIVITGDYLYPIVVSVPAPASQVAYGVYEFAITDKSIRSQDEAIARAQAELTSYQSQLYEGQFRTYEDGLRSGQVITINSTQRGRNIDVLIQSVSARMRDPLGTQLEYTVKFATLKSIGIIEYLQSQLRSKEVIVDDQETLLNFYPFEDEVGTSDTLATPVTSTGPYLWSSADFVYHMQITIDHTKVGTGGVTDFPVYLNLADLGSDFFGHVKADGGDIRITASDGFTILPHELVDIDTGAEIGELHFKAPSLSASVDTVFYIYHGNPDAVAYSASDPSYGSQQVWADYEVVYHFESNGNDATVNAKTLTNNGMVYGAEKIATGAYQDTNGDDFRTGGSYFTDPTIPRTTSLWMKTNMDTASRQVWRYRISATGNEAYRLYIEQNTGYPFVWMVDAGAVGASMIKPTVNVADGNPHKITVIYRSDTKVDMVIDGTLYSGSSTKVPRGSDQLLICDSSLGGGGGIHVDELRVVPEQKAIAWELTAYRNENSPSTFYALAAETEGAAFNAMRWGYFVWGA